MATVEDARLLEMVLVWEEAHERGESVALEELCLDRPDLLSRLRERVQLLGKMNAMLTARDTTVDEFAEPALAPVPPQFPDHEILGELGRGGMSVVYRARDTRLNRWVALKVLLSGPYATHTEQVRFKSEVETIARLQHPHLIQVYEVGEHAGQVFFSMEYMEGGNLEEYLGAGLMAPRLSAHLVRTLAEAIHVAHEQGVVHRDLKPANILISTRRTSERKSGEQRIGVAKISDFGLAKRLDGAAGPTVSGHVLGTPSYMAPEQAKGQNKQVGPGTDIYGLGAILYRLLTGRPPFLCDNIAKTVRQVADDDPVPLRQLQPMIPLDLETICLKCLHKQPAQRYASAAALAEDLRRFLDGEPVLARPIGRYGRTVKWARRRPTAAVLVLVSVLAIVLLIGTGSWFTNRLAAELQNTRAAHQTTLAVRDEMQLSLTRQVADGLDADFRQMEMVPQAIASLLSQRAQWNEQELEQWTRTLVAQQNRIFGIGVAFESGQFFGTRAHDDYCLYVYETANGVHSKQLLPPSYPAPFYRDRAWYSMPKMTGNPWWSEPYLGQRAEGTPMLTYSVPIFRDGTFVGVVFADLSIEYFGELHRRLQEQYLGPDSYSFVISAGGEFVYHPDPRYEFPATDSALDRLRATPDFQSLLNRVRDSRAGSLRTFDFESESPATFFFARIPATDECFVLVHRDTQNTVRSAGSP